MEANNIEILKKIKRVDAPQDMFDNIVNRIQQRNNQKVPVYQVSIAALLIIGLLICNAIMISHHHGHHQKQTGLEKIFTQNNNNLYHE
ncbi:MAG TPA: hypothetical protein PKD51_17615 [Saprospiraceae bacterium]|nr:hypothetical protein [Saprospiraceae bacterium]HMU02952.1 hypothetical protein [Saprospiraceae bacterium]